MQRSYEACEPLRSILFQNLSFPHGVHAQGNWETRKLDLPSTWTRNSTSQQGTCAAMPLSLALFKGPSANYYPSLFSRDNRSRVHVQRCLYPLLFSRDRAPIIIPRSFRGTIAAGYMCSELAIYAIFAKLPIMRIKIASADGCNEIIGFPNLE